MLAIVILITLNLITSAMKKNVTESQQNFQMTVATSAATQRGIY